MASSTRFHWIGSLALVVLMLVAFGVQLGGAQGSTQEQLDLGAQLFAENCAVCHGADGQGRVGATLAKDWPSIRPDLRIKATIENGIQGSPMVAFSQVNGGPLNAEEIDALVAYILSWETGGPRIIPPTPTYLPRPLLTAIPDVEGDPNQGSVLFDRNCAVCHGENGEGRAGATLARVWTSLRPDLGVKNVISNGIQGSPMPAWSQAKGGPLAESEINDLVAFIFTLPEASTVAIPTQVGTTSSPLTWLSGWGGVIITVLLVVLLIVLAVLLQTRRQA